MHTKDTMKTVEFRFERSGETVGLHEIFPGFTIDDRIAILAWRPGGVLEAAPLLMAAIGGFYEELLAVGNDFYDYPDYFAIHAGGQHGYHGWLDIWPERREVVVPNDPDAVLGAISDLGITRLIVQDSPRGSGLLARESVAQVARRLRTILRAGGEPNTDSFTVAPSKAATKLIESAAEASALLIGAEAAALAASDASASRSYTPIELDDALERICHCGETAPAFGMSAAYREAHGVGEATITRHSYDVRA